MASIHKRHRSPYWHCAYTLGNGRRCFRSTKQRDRKKALDVCRAWEKAVESSRRGDFTEVQARKVLDGILESVGEKPIRIESVRDFFLNWLSGKLQAKKVTTGRRYKKKRRSKSFSIRSGAERKNHSLP
jgi:hypothetical protein